MGRFPACYNGNMIQPQIVEYAKSQLKLGVSREAIKSALLEAGWPEADTEDSLRSVAGETFAPAQSSISRVGAKDSIDIGAVFGPKPEIGKVADTKPVIVSDLSSERKTGKMEGGKGVSPGKAEKEVSQTKTASAQANPVFLVPKEGLKHKNFSVLTAILVVVAAGAIGGAGWLYFENYNLKTEVIALTDERGGEVSGLNAKVALLEIEIQTLRAEKESLEKEFSFLAAPTGTEPREFAGLRGALRGGRR